MARTSVALAAALTLCAAPVFAQGRRHRRGNGDDAVAVSSAADADEEVRYGPTTLEDAQGNFETIVRTYVLKKSVDGVWLYADAAGRKRRLTFVSLDAASVKPAKTEGAFTGVGTLRDARTGRRLSLVFTVDFSGADWKVIAVAPLPPKTGG